MWFRSRQTVAALMVGAAFAAAGCAAETSTTHSTATHGNSPPPTAGRTRRVKRPSDRPPPHHSPRPRARSPRHPVAYSAASNEIVQSQRAPGSCHMIGGGLDARPDPTCTPGALNPAVTQATIDRTICVSGWTSTVRPPESVTEQEKMASMAAYGDTGSLGDYEYDHFVPLELGGATNDPRNLWPEPGPSPNAKDTVEDHLRQKVCDGALSLAGAQHEIVTDWVKLAGPSSAARPTGNGSASAQGAQCTASSSYSSTYHDYNVYVHSNQPNRTVTVSDAQGHSDSWHTDGSGYADVYLKSGGYAPGRHITARVGQASCSTTL